MALELGYAVHGPRTEWRISLQGMWRESGPELQNPWFQASRQGGSGMLSVWLQRAACRCPELNADVMRQMGWDAGPRRGLSFVGEGLPWRGRVVGIRMTLQWAVEHGPEVERLLERAHRDLVSGWDRRPRKSTIPSSSQARNGVECTHFCGSDRQT